MSDRLKYERFLWFHGQAKKRAYPNASKLAKEYEISVRTAQRDIDFMAERIKAPLAYSASHKGYHYTSESFELPGSWLTEEDVVALAVAVRLASTVPDKSIKQELCSFLDKILRKTGKKKLRLKDVAEMISVKNIEYSQVTGPQFSVVVDALLNRRPLEIAYHSPHTGESTHRTILPLHLILYLGNWHIIAYCALKKGLRDFMVARIASVKRAAGKLPLPRAFPSVKEYVRKNFGIMQGGKRTQVTLRFSPDIAAWVAEQVWHPKQKAVIGRDGSLSLSFPVADLREIKRRVLTYGSGVKVLAPKRLAKEIADEIRKMAKIYKNKDL